MPACSMRSLLALAALAAAVPALAHADPPPAQEAEAFVDKTEKELRRLWAAKERADFVRATYIMYDTELLAAEAETAQMAFVAEAAKGAVRFDGVEVSPVVRRKLELLKQAITLPAPADPAARDELARLSGELKSLYAKGKYCPGGDESRCQTLGELSGTLASSRDEAVLRDVWLGWHKVSVPMRDRFRRYAELANQGARELGFADMGALWRSKYDMTPEELAREVDRLWDQVRPLYEQLHCHVRAKLRERYGPKVVPAKGPIPAHLLGNMWAQDWSALYDLTRPEKEEQSFDLGRALVRKGIDEREMVRIAERFFVSLGFPKLPETFWERSMFTRPRDREVECHASAWVCDWKEDVRIKMCIERTEEDLITIHHELGHDYYYLMYADHPALFADSANDGFHEAVGDVLALSVTPGYLKSIGLLDEIPGDSLNPLMKRALEKIAFLPFGVVVDRWRWEVLSGKTPPERYNAGWWDLRTRYQGISPPAPRSEKDFDPGAKYHIPSSVPYTRYFIASILQFQFHRALCKAIGHAGPLHTCSIYDRKEAGAPLMAMMRMGMSQPWPDALLKLTGAREMDASALTEYFAPLLVWLKKENAGRTCGW